MWTTNVLFSAEAVYVSQEVGNNCIYEANLLISLVIVCSSDHGLIS